MVAKLHIKRTKLVNKSKNNGFSEKNVTVPVLKFLISTLNNKNFNKPLHLYDQYCTVKETLELRPVAYLTEVHN
jgi:hypothetical protein